MGGGNSMRMTVGYLLFSITSHFDALWILLPATYLIRLKPKEHRHHTSYNSDVWLSAQLHYFHSCDTFYAGGLLQLFSLDYPGYLGYPGYPDYPGFLSL